MGRAIKTRIRFLPFGAAFLAMLLALWSCGDISVLTTLRTMEAGPAATPTFSPSGGTYSSDQSVTIADSTSGATIYYTIDGTTPTTSSTAYGSTPIPVAGNGTAVTINAIAAKSGMINSTAASATYTINYSQVSTPTFSPAAGSFTSIQSVTIGSSTSGASIRYTTDGSTPTETLGTLYTAPINVAASQIIKAIAYESGWIDSSVASATYSVTLYFLYVANGNNPATVSAFQINTSTGALTAISGSPFSEGVGASNSNGIAVDPTGKCVYTANANNTATVSALTINTTTGALTAISGSPFGTGGNWAQTVAVYPGKYVYSQSDTSPGYLDYQAIGTGGALSGGSSIAAGISAYGVALDPTGPFAYVSDNNNPGAAYAFKINSTTGAPSLINSYSTGKNAQGVAVVPGKFVYVANGGDGNVSAFTINTTSGALTAIVGSPFAAGTGSDSVAADPTGTHLYVANGGAGTISAFTIGSGGALTGVAGSPFTAGTYPFGVVVDPTGMYVYVTNNTDSTISAYSIGTGGALTALTSSGSPFANGATHPSGIAIAVMGP